jgi:hypothetical protein
VLFAEILDAFQHGDTAGLRNYISDHEDFHNLIVEAGNRKPRTLDRQS